MTEVEFDKERLRILGEVRDPTEQWRKMCDLRDKAPPCVDAKYVLRKALYEYMVCKENNDDMLLHMSGQCGRISFFDEPEA